MPKVIINDPSTNRTAPQQPRQRCPEGLESYKALPPPKAPNRHPQPLGPLDDIAFDSDILNSAEGQKLGKSPLDFLTEHLPDFSSATKIFTTRLFLPNTKVAREFHAACDNVPNVLVIIKSGQYIAGGFTAVAFESPESFHLKADPNFSTFLFSLNRHKLYPLKDKDYAIVCDKEYGPIFGCSGICIGDNYANDKYFETCYEENSSFYDSSAVEGELFGTVRFTVDEYEVFQLQ